MVFLANKLLIGISICIFNQVFNESLGMTPWLSCVMFSCVFVTFSYGVLGQMRYLIVLIPDLCLLLYLDICNHLKPLNNKYMTDN